MHYADFILSTHGLLSRIWLAAHWDKKLNKNSVVSTDIVKSIEKILSPNINVALKTTGHLLLGVVKIYSRQTIYLLHDCSEALTIFSVHSRSTKSQNSHNTQNQSNSNVNNRSRKNKTNIATFNLRSNQSRAEDITLQPPDDFLNEMMLFKEFDDNFFNDFEQDRHLNQFPDVSQIETMRFTDQPSSLVNDISYEVARDQSMANQNDHTGLFDTTDLPSLGDKLTTTNQSLFSNINMDDLDIDTIPDNNQNEIIDSALNNFTIGEDLSTDQFNKMMSVLNDPSRLDQVQLDSLDSYSKSLQKSRSKGNSSSTMSRKRRLIVDNVNVITENDDQSLINFKSIVNSPSSILSTQPHPQKENIPPPDSLIDSTINSSIPLMTIRNNSSVLMPLARRCANLLSTNYHSAHFRSQPNHTQAVDENIDTFTEHHTNTITAMDNYDFNEDFPVDYNNTNFESSNIATVGTMDNITDETEFYDLDKTLDKSLEKYDSGDITWSRTTADMAKNLLRIYKSSSSDVNFKKYVKSANISGRKSVAQHFYSLLILQRENLFEITQQNPYEDIFIRPTPKLTSTTQLSHVSADDSLNNFSVVFPDR